MRKSQLSFAFILMTLAFCTGCPVTENRPAPGQRLTLHDPELQREYQLYVPTSYNHQRRFPLVVTCHGTHPFDSASAQLDEWKGLAEQKGFLVAAPELIGTSALGGASAQVARQVEDERALLAIVRDVSAARSIDDTRVFLTGWSAGSYAVLFTGLRHPEVFRALAVRQGNFKEDYVLPAIPFLDPHQPVLLMFGNLDPLKDESEDAVTWMQNKGLQPTRLERTGAHKRDPEPVYSFFVDTVRNRPWIRLNVEDDGNDAMRVRLHAKASFDVNRYWWDFGDEQQSPVASPVHIYEKPGTYTVKVAVYTAGDKVFVRQIQLQVPRVRLGAVPVAPSTTP